MAVMLYHRDGKSIRVEPEDFSTYLDSGDWFLTVEKSQEPISMVLNLDEMGDYNIRELARDYGIKSWGQKGIEKLKTEIKACQPEN